MGALGFGLCATSRPGPTTNRHPADAPHEQPPLDRQDGGPPYRHDRQPYQAAEDGDVAADHDD
eukprot:8281095-Alexandrium_andersonii.AAC.1